MSSTRNDLKESFQRKSDSPKVSLDSVYLSVRDVTGARSLGQLPRGPSDIYNARHAAKRAAEHVDEKIVSLPSSSATAVLPDGLWMLLEQAKREEEISKDAIFIRECNIHPTLTVVLATDQQLNEISQFCTNPSEFCVFGVDPTFNIFTTNISLTVTTYRNLRLEHKETGEPPVFIGPLLLHQKKDWRTYARFANRMITECPAMERVLACGLDGEQALIDGFSRNFHFAAFLRCFLHFKDHLKRELTRQGITACSQKLFLEEILGKQEGSVMFFGLVDCETKDEVMDKLEKLKPEWDKREKAPNGSSKSTFYEWFLKEKVCSSVSFTFCFLSGRLNFLADVE